MIWLLVSNIFLFSSLLGEDSHFDSYFSDGLKPPTRQDDGYLPSSEDSESSFFPGFLFRGCNEICINLEFTCIELMIG